MPVDHPLTFVRCSVKALMTGGAVNQRLIKRRLDAIEAAKRAGKKEPVRPRTAPALSRQTQSS